MVEERDKQLGVRKRGEGGERGGETAPLLFFSFFLTFFAPFVLLADLGLLLGAKVVGDVEGAADLLGGLALDHGGDGGAREVEEGLDVHVVGGEDELEEEDLLDVDEVGVPLLDDLGHDGGLEGLLDLGHGLGLVVLAEVDDLLEDGGLDVGEGDLGDGVVVVVIVVPVLVHHGLDELGHLGDLGGDLEGVSLLADLLCMLCLMFVSRGRGGVSEPDRKNRTGDGSGANGRTRPEPGDQNQKER